MNRFRARAPYCPARSVVFAAALACLHANPIVLLGQERESGSVRLELGAEPGRTLVYQHEKHLRLQLPEELGGEAETRTYLRLGQRVESRGPDSVVVSSEIREFRFEVDPRPDQLPDFARLEGLRFRSTSTPAGRIYRIEVEGTSGPVANSLRDQVEVWLRELGFPALAPGPVKVGESWTDTSRVPLSTLLGLQGDTDAVEVRTTKLSSIERTAEGAVAQIDVVTRWTDAGEGPSPEVSVRGSSSQAVRFDLDRKLFQDSRGTSRIRVEISSASGAPPIRIDAEGSYDTHLLMTED
ncbi:MAG: hypothetical protein M8860_00350 [marine benthic group bacterium]|nr:hypothetical protein [Candidatus Carthagonibacter metallireducens]